MSENIKIALIGKSGSGKTTIAEYLNLKYNFVICKTGKRCREIAKEFFNSESKDILQKLTDAFNGIEKGVWLKVALKDKSIHKQNVVIDSIRFMEDYNYAKKNKFLIWKIETPFEIRLRRLNKRSQDYKIRNDDHNSEMELDRITPDLLLENNFDSIDKLYDLIDRNVNHV